VLLLHEIPLSIKDTCYPLPSHEGWIKFRGAGQPDEQSHHVEVARLRPPPDGCPGSVGSKRCAVFEKSVPRGMLDFSGGTRIEFELVGPPGASILIDNWDPQVFCSLLYCKDVTGDAGVTVKDFLTVLAKFGEPTELNAAGQSAVCCEGVFSADGTIDMDDITSWDWLLRRSDPSNICDVPLRRGLSAAAPFLKVGPFISTAAANTLPAGLVIAGKRGSNEDSTKLDDSLYFPDGPGPASVSRGSGKLVLDHQGQLHQINSDQGLVRLSDGHVVLPANSSCAIAREPRYGAAATVYAGLQQDPAGAWGRPILDAAFDKSGNLYAVPVLVVPAGQEPYLAAAKFHLQAGDATLYGLVMIYDSPPRSGDNRDLRFLREIEVDDSNNVYVVNSCDRNESDTLWVYPADSGQAMDVRLSQPGRGIPVSAPATLCAAKRDPMLYLTSARNAADAPSAIVYGLSTVTLDVERSIVIEGMGHVTDITEDPATGALWVVGFTMKNIPDQINSDDPPFYSPRLACIPRGQTGTVTSVDISGLYDLGLPVSVRWNSTNR
jgi:hypothetical protein